MIIATRAQRRQLERDNAKRPDVLEVISPNEWIANPPPKLVKAWRSKDFLVQAFTENEGVLRLSVNRTTLSTDGRWLENITWGELVELKRQAGFGDWYAVEIYPKDKDMVNVANMRHLWVMLEPLNIGWLNEKAQ